MKHTPPQKPEFYESPSKTTWRGWVWNRIAERIPKVYRRDAIVLYLVGPDDKDREVALSKDFRNINLVAIDKEPEFIDAVRAKGNLGIVGKLEDVMAVWPIDMPIAAVLADFTCGLSHIVDLFTYSLIMSRGIMMGRTVVAVNMQRGRDPHSNPVREAIGGALADCQKFGVYDPPPSRTVRTSRKRHGRQVERISLEEVLTDQLHRGKQLFSRLYYSFCVNAKPNSIEELQDMVSFGEAIIKETNPVFNSYRQKAAMPYMDSVVFNMFPGKREPFSTMLPLYEKEVSHQRMQQMVRKIAAFRAVRTKRMA